MSRLIVLYLTPTIALFAWLAGNWNDMTYAGEPSEANHSVATMPDGYHLQLYDDAGIPDRSPHILDRGTHVYSQAEVNADERIRSVAWGWKSVRARFENLNPNLDYILAVTYANEAGNARVQSLWTGNIRLHGPRALPRGGWERLLFRIPRPLPSGGTLEIECRLEGPVNVVVSALELWAPSPSPPTLRIEDVSGLMTDLEGRVVDLAYDPMPGATVMLQRPNRIANDEADGVVLAETVTDADGRFRFPRRLFDNLAKDGSLLLEARMKDGTTAKRSVETEETHFDAVRYRPVPAKTADLRRPVISLDGRWRILAPPAAIGADESKDGAGETSPMGDWKPFVVPGQFVQQGFDAAPDRSVRLAREFVIPGEWKEHRILLRFDAIHAGTTYRLNGHELGLSENLFTPVEWEVTDAARIGGRNRLELEMTVETESERLSYSSGYAFHNLGGIDRKVRLFAVPRVHFRHLRIDAGLRDHYRTGVLSVRYGLDHGDASPASDLTIHLTLTDTGGNEAGRMTMTPPESGDGDVEMTIPNVTAWNAEKPVLYRLFIDLLRGDRVIERIERRIGFRTIEVRQSKLFINGRSVKLAGACRHEIDPLTGRAGTARHAERDVRLMKGANLNFLRTAHYPPTEELLDAADRLGMYLEVEAPFCWVAPDPTLRNLRRILEPTTAMVDACGSHPSVIVWSLANESTFNRTFEIANDVVKSLDPGRPTTFNNPDPKRLCDIANLHYASMPFDSHLPDDPRPLFWGEYFFPVCHEQTDVRINPGLRELWGAGHSDPDSPWGQECAASFGRSFLQPGEPPGFWPHVLRSERVLGGAIWALIDEPFYLPGGRKAGYAWHHGFWGIIDAWRRPKPEWWLSKMIFSPIRFPERRLSFPTDRRELRLRVENRYDFTDLSEFRFHWRIGRRSGEAKVSAEPGTTGTLVIPVPGESREGDRLTVRPIDSHGEQVTVLSVPLGKERIPPPPNPAGGLPRWRDEDSVIRVEGRGFTLTLDKAAGTFVTSQSGPGAGKSLPGAFPVRQWPSPHVTRFDFADLKPDAPPYAVLPDASTRRVDEVSATETPEGLAMTIRDRYEAFVGAVTWVVDRRGVGRIDYDYVYTGDDLSAREIGLRVSLDPMCEILRWKRWSEWGEYPADSISRTEGTAMARRPGRSGPITEHTRPSWPWRLDETEMGTNDFRGVKLNIYEASLRTPDGSGFAVHARGDLHTRASRREDAVTLHILSHCRLGPVTLRNGDHVTGHVAAAVLYRR